MLSECSRQRPCVIPWYLLWPLLALAHAVMHVSMAPLTGQRYSSKPGTSTSSGRRVPQPWQKPSRMLRSSVGLSGSSDICRVFMPAQYEPSSHSPSWSLGCQRQRLTERLDEKDIITRIWHVTMTTVDVYQRHRVELRVPSFKQRMRVTWCQLVGGSSRFSPSSSGSTAFRSVGLLVSPAGAVATNCAGAVLVGKLVLPSGASIWRSERSTMSSGGSGCTAALERWRTPSPMGGSTDAIAVAPQVVRTRWRQLSERSGHRNSY